VGKDDKQARVAPVVLWRRELLGSESLGKHGVSVGLALSVYMNPEGGNAWPAVATLAKGLKVSPRSVQRGLRELESEGFIVGAARRGRPTNYGATVRGVPAAEALQGELSNEGVSGSTRGYVPETPEVVKDLEKPNWSIDPRLLDRVMEERPGIRDWVLLAEGFHLADNPALFREVISEKFPGLPEAVTEGLRVKALGHARIRSAITRSLPSSAEHGAVLEPVTSPAFAYTAEMSTVEQELVLRYGDTAKTSNGSDAEKRLLLERCLIAEGRARMNDPSHVP
jgi:DNA-binding Lrp family transcriptional regulator